MDPDDYITGTFDSNNPSNQEELSEEIFDSNDLQECLDYFRETGDSEPLENAIAYNELVKQRLKEQTCVSGSFITDVEKLTNDIIKYFPKFFGDFTNFEYGTGAPAGNDFKKIFNKAKKVNNTAMAAVFQPTIGACYALAFLS